MKMKALQRMHAMSSTTKRKRQTYSSSSSIVDLYKCAFGETHACSSSRNNSSMGEAHSAIEDLPYETFLHVISYLGPSTSLTAMSCVSRRYNRFMRRIGDIMLTKAKHCFRCPLRSSGGINQESAISIFVRYSSYCRHVNETLQILNRLLSSIHISEECDDRPIKRCRSTQDKSPRRMGLSSKVISAVNADKALDISHDLLTELSNSISSPDQRHICCSYELESKVIATAGKVGGLVFKHGKAALEKLQQENQGLLTGDAEGGSPSDMRQGLEKHISLDLERIDKARVLMQKVVFYKLLFECNAKHDGM